MDVPKRFFLKGEDEHEKGKFFNKAGIRRFNHFYFFCLFLSGIVLVTYLVIFLGGFSKVWGVDSSFTLNHYRLVFTNTLRSIINSLLLSSIGSLFAMLLGLLIAYFIVRQSFLGKKVMDFLRTLPYAVPGSMMGLGFVVALNKAPLILTGTAFIIVLDYCIRRMPFGLRSGISTLRQIDVAMEEAMSISHTTVIMHKGNIEQAGTPLEIYRHPQTPFVAEFIGTTNFSKGQLVEVGDPALEVRIHDTIIALPMAGEYKSGQEVRVVLRPEMIRFAETKREGKLTGKVQEVSSLGSMARYLVEMEGGDLISVDEHNPKRFRHKGSPVFLILDEEGLHLQKI